MEKTRILVWDLPVRLFHWLLAGSFTVAFVTAEAESWRNLHVAFGYAFVALLLFRLLWGFMGSRYARFSSFAYGPGRVLAYLRSMMSGKPEHHIGHNPAGSWAIFAMIMLGVAVGVSGLAMGYTTGGKWIEELHEGLSFAMLGLVVVHVLGVIVGSLMHGENLVASMLTGYKRGSPGAAIRGSRRVVAAALVVAVGATFAWALTSPQAQLVVAKAKAERGDHGHKDHDDDD